FRTVILSSETFCCVDAVPTCPEAPGRSPAMSEPLVVLLPHRRGKDEALRRIKDGLGRAKGEFAWLLSIDQDVWTGDRLSFRASALGQTATGFIDVYEANVRVEVTLPWLLARFAHAAQRVIGQKGQLMLEKKSPALVSFPVRAPNSAVRCYRRPRQSRSLSRPAAACWPDDGRTPPTCLWRNLTGRSQSRRYPQRYLARLKRAGESRRDRDAGVRQVFAHGYTRHPTARHSARAAVGRAERGMNLDRV